MSGLTVDVSGVTALASKLNGSAGVIESELKVGVQRSGLLVQRTGMSTVKVATGRLRQAHTEITKGLTSTVSANTPYAKVIHDGRRPGARMPPSSALIGWRGVTAANAFVVARAIGRKGIVGDKWLEKALQSNQAAIVAELTQAAIRALRKLGL